MTPGVVLLALASATMWLLFTRWVRLPANPALALVSAYSGAAMAKAGVVRGLERIREGLNFSRGNGLAVTLLFVVIGPMIGLAAGYLLVIGMTWIIRRAQPGRVVFWSTRLQLASAALAVTTGAANEVQKTSGMLIASLLASGYASDAAHSGWVIAGPVAAYILGMSVAARRRESRSHARRRRRTAFCADLGTAFAIAVSTGFGIPVASSEVTVATAAGVVSTRSFKAVRWGVLNPIISSWFVTVPACAVAGFVLVASFA